MTKKYSLKAQKRDVFGRKVKKIRLEGKVPANVYGKKVKSYPVSVDLKEFSGVYKNAGETNLVEVSSGKKKESVLISNVQNHPVTGELLHIDFRAVDLKEKITAAIPLEIVGEPPAVKKGLGTLVQLMDELEVEALPLDLMDKIEVDVSKLEEVDQAITVADLKFDKTKLTPDASDEQMVAKIDALQEEEEEPAPVAGGEEEAAEEAEETDETEEEAPPKEE